MICALGFTIPVHPASSYDIMTRPAVTTRITGERKFTMNIGLKYDPQTNTLEVVNGTTTVHRNTKFSFSSTTGKLETKFKGNSPDDKDVPSQTRAAGHEYSAAKPGKYHFDCFIDGVPVKIGGDMEVLPTEP